MELSAAVREVQSHGDSVQKRYIPPSAGRAAGENQLEVIPVQVPGIEGQYYLILFENGTQKPIQSRSSGRLSRLRTNRLEKIPASQSSDNAQLRRELEALQNFLKLTIEEHETVKEEMKSAHEELLSMNEEYLSTNEELETAKEELQSTNEELAVTNEELRNRNDELNHANRELKSSRDHSEAIIETMREGLLVLDSDFRVIQANHSFYECFNTRPQDTIDRTLFELGDGQWSIPMLHELLEKVLPEKRSLRVMKLPTLSQRSAKE
jgi:two-component system CheB/CheR fusion protein